MKSREIKSQTLTLVQGLDTHIFMRVPAVLLTAFTHALTTLIKTLTIMYGSRNHVMIANGFVMTSIAILSFEAIV